ncbi:hypothetical protein AAG906_028963 [Vitis piasezkii]
MDLLLQEFNLQIEIKGVENVVVTTVKKALWYAHIANYLVTCEVPSEWNAQDRKHFFAKIHAYYWEEPFLFKYCADQIIWKCVLEEEQQGILNHCHENAYYVSKWVEAIPCKHNDHRVVLKFLKENIFSRFGVPKAIISDGASKQEIKNILTKVVITSEKIVKHGLDRAGAKRCLDLNEMEKLRNDAYINSKVAKQRMKRLHVFQEAQVKVDRPFHYSPSASQWSGGISNSKSTDIFKVNGHRLKPFIEPFKPEKEDINLLEPRKPNQIRVRWTWFHQSP